MRPIQIFLVGGIGLAAMVFAAVLVPPIRMPLPQEVRVQQEENKARRDQNFKMLTEENMDLRDEKRAAELYRQAVRDSGRDRTHVGE